MYGKEGIRNESYRKLVQDFSAEQIQQLAKAIYSLNNNGKSDMFVSSAGLLAHNSSSNSAFTKPWILDSGAADHIASDSQLFTHTLSSFISNVNLPTGSTVPISSTGTIKFNDKITLKDVLCVPSFNLNPMSVSKITSLLNCCVVFTPHGCAFYRTWLRGG